MSEKYKTENYIAFHKALEKMLEAMVNNWGYSTMVPNDG